MGAVEDQLASLGKALAAMATAAAGNTAKAPQGPSGPQHLNAFEESAQKDAVPEARNRIFLGLQCFALCWLILLVYVFTASKFVKLKTRIKHSLHSNKIEAVTLTLGNIIFFPTIQKIAFWIAGMPLRLAKRAGLISSDLLSSHSSMEAATAGYTDI